MLSQKWYQLIRLKLLCFHPTFFLTHKTDYATPRVLSWCVYTYCTYIPPHTVPLGGLSAPTGLPLNLSEISILSSYVSITRLSFPVLYFPRLHSPHLLTSSPLVCVCVPQFLFVSLDLFRYGHVTLLRTFWCISRIMTRLVILL